MDPKLCSNAEKNGLTVKMKEFTAGSKAKTVQLADSKCSLCPLDIQIEKLPPRYSVCVWQGSRDKEGESPTGPCFCLAPGLVPGDQGGGWASLQNTDPAPSRRAEGAGLRGITVHVWHRCLATRCVVVNLHHPKASPPNGQVRLGLSACPVPQLMGSDGGLQSPSWWQVGCGHPKQRLP